MQKKLQNSSINCQKTTTSRYEEPEAGILEVCGKHLIDFHPLLGNVHVAFF